MLAKEVTEVEELVIIVKKVEEEEKKVVTAVKEQEEVVVVVVRVRVVSVLGWIWLRLKDMAFFNQ